MSYAPGDTVQFTPDKGTKRFGVIAPGFVDDGFVKVHLQGDPFPVDLKESQVSSCDESEVVVTSKQKVPKSGAKRKSKEKKMSTASSEAKELRQRAKSLGIEDWENLGRKEMRKAVEKAEAALAGDADETPKAKKASKKAKTKEKKDVKAEKVAKKSSAPEGSDEALGLSFARGTTAKDLPDEGVNPFRKNSNLHLVAKLLLKGGTRRSLAEQMATKVTLHPYQKDADTVDLNDYDKRIVLGAQTMRDQFGYGVQRQGRGLDGKIKVFRPGGAGDPRAKKAKK